MQRKIAEMGFTLAMYALFCVKPKFLFFTEYSRR